MYSNIVICTRNAVAHAAAALSPHPSKLENPSRKPRRRGLGGFGRQLKGVESTWQKNSKQTKTSKKLSRANQWPTGNTFISQNRLGAWEITRSPNSSRKLLIKRQPTPFHTSNSSTSLPP